MTHDNPRYVKLDDVVEAVKAAAAIRAEAKRVAEFNRLRPNLSQRARRDAQVQQAAFENAAITVERLARTYTFPTKPDRPLTRYERFALWYWMTFVGRGKCLCNVGLHRLCQRLEDKACEAGL